MNGTRTIVAVMVVGAAALVAGVFVFLRPDGPATHTVTLPSGRDVDVIHMGMDGPASQFWSFSYRTHLPMNQPGLVACEVAGLWKELRPQVDGTPAREAIVEPESYSKQLVFAGWRPLIVSNVSTGYVFVKRETGDWTQRGGPYCGE